MSVLKYSEILKANSQLGRSLSGKKYEVRILSNIVTSQINEILEYSLRCENINATVQSGDFDNIPQDSIRFKDSNLVIIFWETANIVDGLQYNSDLMSKEQIESILSKLKMEIDFIYENLKTTSLVLINTFSSKVFLQEDVRETNFCRLSEDLNHYLKDKKSSNVILVDIDKILAKVSIERSVDFRFFYSSKALYTVEFYRNYVEYIKPIILSVNGRTKKVLVFDCDNTLWSGILGEDGFRGIEMSSKSNKGVFFEEVQTLALSLKKHGVLIALCSKNNPQDVDEVLTKHPDIKLKNDDIAVKKVNWNDKVTNLKDIAKELNVGLDSFVMVEDSDFEVNYIREFLPQVAVLQVPKNLHEYPGVFRKHMALFYNRSESIEDLRKTEMYEQQAKRELDKSYFNNLDDYLMSLELKLAIHIDNNSIIPRISQMTQKTNQFNLTTERYTESDIERYVGDKGYKVITLSVRDKYGDYGVTGLCIIRLQNNNERGEIDTFLMSCRIIGRNIEFAFFDFVINLLNEAGVVSLEAKYTKTLKNEQVVGFYEKLGFELIKKSELEKHYRLKISQYNPRNINYIGVEKWKVESEM